MFLQFYVPWLSRVFCGLLIATMIAPEVRCCCNLSWGPAGVFQSVRSQPVSQAKRCSCCASRAGQNSPAHECRSCGPCDGQCTFWTAPVAPVAKTFDWEAVAPMPTHIDTTLATSSNGHRVAAVEHPPHSLSLTAPQHCALFQSWQT